jgi:hypothetical protein
VLGGGGGAGRSASGGGLRSARGAGGGVSTSTARCSLGVSLAGPPSASSRYGLSVASAGLVGRVPRLRRVGRRRSFMPLLSKKVESVPCPRTRRACSHRAVSELCLDVSMLVGIARGQSRRAMKSVYDGIKKCSTRRVLCCRYRQGADSSRASNDAGATARLDVWTWSLSSEGPGTPDVLAGGTTSRSCRRTPRVSPLLQFGATLQSVSVGPLRGSPYPRATEQRTSCPLP